MRFGHISEQEVRRRLAAAEEENRRLGDKLHLLETSSWADSVMIGEGWRQRALVAEVALKETKEALGRAAAEIEHLQDAYCRVLEGL